MRPNAAACDACACSIFSQPNGLLANYRKNFLSLGYSHSTFTGNPGSGEGATDIFQTIDLSFEYYFSKRLRAGMILPYSANTRQANQLETTINGFSDIRMNMNYTFFKHEKENSKWEIYLEGGTGLILPSGKYIPDIHNQNLPENFNPGKGSYGYSLLQTSGVSYKSFGCVITNTWSDFGSTSSGYKYGSQWISNFLFLAEIPLDSTLSVIPLGSFQFEKIQNDTYSTDASVHGTGGHGTFYSAGVQVKVNNWLFTVQLSHPIVEKYSDGEVNAGNRYSVQMAHLF